MDFHGIKQPGSAFPEEQMMISGKARITIVTPFYNAGKYFRQTVCSVMSQTFPWFEWVIVDDGSSRQDDAAMLDRLSRSDERIVVVHQKNHGLAHARNTGIRIAKTDLIVPLDADDLISPQYLEYVFFGLYFHPSAAWCYTDVVGFGEQEYLWRYTWNAKKLKRYNFLTATAAIRKKALMETGGYKIEKNSYYEDWRLWLEFLEKHQYPVHVKGYLFWYRRMQSGMLSGIRSDQKQKYISRKIIRQAAEKADGKVRAIEYPVNRTRMPYERPKIENSWKNYKAVSAKQKIRVLFLIPWMVMGGADQLNLALAGGLDKGKFDISMMTTVVSEHEWQKHFLQYTDRIFHLPDFLDPAHYLEYVSYYIQTRGIDLLFLSNAYCGYYMLPFLRKQFPKLIIVDYVHMEEWYWKNGGFARLSGVFGPFLDQTYVSNSTTCQVMIEQFGRDPKNVIKMYIGADTERFDAKKIKQGRLYDKLNVSKKRPIILYPCRISPQKRPYLMLDIAEMTRKKQPDILFVAVGDGSLRRELARKIKKRRLGKNVVCMDPTEHMEEYYKDAKLTLICSIKEGLSLTAYESCAMGTPVISSDVGGQRDLIDDSMGILIPIHQNEATGLQEEHYAEEEVREYTQAILKLLRNQSFYKQCCENSRKKMEDCFSLKRMLKNVEEEWSALVSEKNRKAECANAASETGRFQLLSEEIYSMELAEEERSRASLALLEFLDTMLSAVLPEKSRRRQIAKSLYKRWKSDDRRSRI